MFLSPGDLADEHKCAELLAERVEAFVNQNSQLAPGPTSTNEASHNLYRYIIYIQWDLLQIRVTVGTNH